MKRRIENPRIMLLDCSLEYQKVIFYNSKAFYQRSTLGREPDRYGTFERSRFHANPPARRKLHQGNLRQHHRAQARFDLYRKGHFRSCAALFGQGWHYRYPLRLSLCPLAKILAIRRVRKTDNLRIARCCGATIKSRTDEITEADIGTDAGLFEIKKFGEEYFTYVTECKKNTACTIILRGASKDVLMEVERNLQDAMQVSSTLPSFCLNSPRSREMSSSSAKSSQVVAHASSPSATS